VSTTIFEAVEKGRGALPAQRQTSMHNQKPEPHTKMWEDATQTRLMEFYFLNKDG
jgi:hypothetical protein